MASSEQFMQIYRHLPHEEQQILVEDQLVPLLDALSVKKRDRLIRSAKRQQAQYDKAPRLDLTGKKREMQRLFMMLSKDDKVAFTKERSNREEILQEAVHSISSWLSKIWLMVYEYKINYGQAHACLLYTLRTLATFEDSPYIGECKCFFNNLYVAVPLKDRRRRTVKYFSFTCPRKLEQPCLWIWRDLFLSMLVNDRYSKPLVQEMLSDIEDHLGWPGLERLLYGGRRSLEDEDDYFDDDGEDETDEEEYLKAYEQVATDNEFGPDHLDGRCCRLHAEYWSDEMNKERITLQSMVKTRLLELFCEAPDAHLFNAVQSISRDSTSKVTNQMLKVVSEVAEYSADAYIAALIIHTNLYQPQRIVELLQSHYHHLRPSDCPILLHSVSLLADSPYRPHALKFIERELLDTVQHVFVAVCSAFRYFSEEVNRADLAEILKSSSDSSDRADRIERWVDRTMTPSSDTVNPMTFAAMMMGFPVAPPNSLDETNLLTYVDLSKPDPDLDGLREEFKPDLRRRFESWTLLAQTMPKDCSPILQRVYTKIVELMPFFRAADVIGTMTTRLADRPNKKHIHEAMVNVSSFCEGYRKSLYLRSDQRARTKKTARKNTTPQPTSTSAGGGATPSTPAPAAAANTPTANAPPSAATATPTPMGPAPPPVTTPGPIFHFFGNNPGAGPIASFFSHPITIPIPPNPQPPPTNNQNPPNPPFPSPGGPGPTSSPLPPPPDCNHQ